MIAATFYPLASIAYIITRGEIVYNFDDFTVLKIIELISVISISIAALIASVFMLPKIADGTYVIKKKNTKTRTTEKKIIITKKKVI